MNIPCIYLCNLDLFQETRSNLELTGKIQDTAMFSAVSMKLKS